jgi:hypothetical protein
VRHSRVRPKVRLRPNWAEVSVKKLATLPLLLNWHCLFNFNMSFNDSYPRDDQPTAKRRKVRKGTRNCWECKRRKVRCTFDAATDTNCENCFRRGTACVSQEHNDEQEMRIQKIKGDQEARLSRVEILLERLIGNGTTIQGSRFRDDHATVRIIQASALL